MPYKQEVLESLGEAEDAQIAYIQCLETELILLEKTTVRRVAAEPRGTWGKHLYLSRSRRVA